MVDRMESALQKIDVGEITAEEPSRLCAPLPKGRTQSNAQLPPSRSRKARACSAGRLTSRGLHDSGNPQSELSQFAPSQTRHSRVTPEVDTMIDARGVGAVCQDCAQPLGVACSSRMSSATLAIVRASPSIRTEISRTSDASGNVGAWEVRAAQKGSIRSID